LPRNRIIRIALLPILAPIFLVGWALAHIGEQKLVSAKTPRPKVSIANKESGVEIGVFEAKEEMVVA
jgi:hypothetical protein